MYRFMLTLHPEDLEAEAAQAYLDMLRGGFTSVAEFHYVHRQPDGRPYANPAEMSERIVAAARTVGIGLTLAPVLYAAGGIGKPPENDQRRFLLDLDGYLGLVETMRRHVTVTVAPHSLRAVPADLLLGLLAARPDGPVHIHAAERTEEVEECRAGLGAAPVEWLLAHAGLDERWTLVHATHMTDAERDGLARAGAVAGVCPLTEANLGDGRFRLRGYHRAGGRFGIGSDANTLISVADELRMLEYGQRLHHRRRNVVVAPGDEATESPGRVLFDSARRGGAQSLAQPVGALAAGRRADLVVLDPAAPALLGQSPRSVLDAWVISGGMAGGTPVRDVMVAGRWVVRDRRHQAEDSIRARFTAVMRRHHP
jgi:formimidoylglutamate deiminase